MAVLACILACTVDANRGPRLNLDALVLQAAVQGQGLALIDESLAAGEVAQGRLVKPFDSLCERGEMESELCYFLVCPESKRDNPKVVTFHEWLFAELE